jgi:hypothetical protein
MAIITTTAMVTATEMVMAMVVTETTVAVTDHENI